MDILILWSSSWLPNETEAIEFRSKIIYICIFLFICTFILGIILDLKLTDYQKVKKYVMKIFDKRRD